MTESEIRVLMSMRRKKRDKQGRIKCDMCETALYSERHHIIQKSQTTSNEEAREIANGHLLTAFLCKACHEDIDRPENREALLQKLYVINGAGDAEIGYDLMKAKFDKAVESGAGILWELPKLKQKKSC